MKYCVTYLISVLEKELLCFISVYIIDDFCFLLLLWHILSLFIISKKIGNDKTLVKKIDFSRACDIRDKWTIQH